MKNWVARWSGVLLSYNHHDNTQSVPGRICGARREISTAHRQWQEQSRGLGVPWQFDHLRLSSFRFTATVDGDESRWNRSDKSEPYRVSFFRGMVLEGRQAFL